MHEEDSSSANDNSSALIEHIEWTSAGILKICLVDGPSFFIRDEYYFIFDTDLPVSGSVLHSEKIQYIHIAASMLLCETSVLRYLAQREHTRYQLVLKLEKKGFIPAIYNPVLDRSYRLSFFDDYRFAQEWLQIRAQRSLEGRSKLYAGLLSRGVHRDVAKKALDVFFETENEKEICNKSLLKLLRIKRSNDSLVRSLQMKGFSYKIIKECLSELGIK